MTPPMHQAVVLAPVIPAASGLTSLVFHQESQVAW